MKFTIDLKSALTGILVGITIMLVVAAESRPTYSGRYQASAGQGLAVIVDTQTGQAWGFGPPNTTQYRNDANFWDAK